MLGWAVPRAGSRAGEVPVAVPDAINKRVRGNDTNSAERRSFQAAILVPACLLVLAAHHCLYRMMQLHAKETGTVSTR
jgi:hypothetical protein